jgi:2-polyprenyl-3-methyl-5-hydroxy-6-metoxy-1,4-benzoquinol methylase
MNRIDLGNLQFYWRMAESYHEPSPVPKFLPFAFGFDARTQLITQEWDECVHAALRQVYLEDHNIGYMQSGHALADKYGQDFLRFIHAALSKSGNRVRRLMDIGCGGCYVLHELKAAGYDVFGIDPGPTTARHAAELGIPVATGFYPLAHGFGKMDAVLSSGTLEHVTDPVAFLRAHHADLTDDGLLIVSVPDSTPSIALGDLSMILHEHISYFDEDSLRRVVTEAGFDVIETAYASYGASLYCVARRARQGGIRANPGTARFHSFANKVHAACRRFETYVQPLLKRRDVSVGFYVPLRPLPYLSRIGAFRGFRFFDDDPGVHGKYFDGFNVPVENFADLQARPVSHMVIMSLPHAPAIARKIREHFGNRLVVTSLEEILTDMQGAACAA